MLRTVLMPGRPLLNIIAVLLFAAVGSGALAPAGGAQDTGVLKRQIDGKKSREQRLGSQAARLSRLERGVSAQVEILQKRVAEAQSELNLAQTRLVTTQRDLRGERARALRLRGRLAQARATLARLLRDRYETGAPDLVTVVLNSKGFADLLERAAFTRRVRDRDTEIVDTVRSARRDAKGETRRLARLELRRSADAEAVQRRHDALASMAAAVEQRRAALAQARAARLALRRATISSRRRAQRTLNRLLAQQRRAELSPGPGGPWAIPWPVVQCESGGQNLPPNFAGASGYYQFLPSTWQGMGGSTPAAYLASKAEQDRLAARLWDHGRGARNWVCAGLVGIT